jgi:hypothetical protein
METQLQPPQTISPFLSIWVKPRETIRNIVATDPTRHVLLLAMLAGVFQALDRAVSRSVGDTLPLVFILAIVIIAGPIGGIFSMYFFGALFRWSGSKLGGRATSEEVRAAYAWASLPTIFLLPLWIPQLLIFGEEMFTSSMPSVEANPYLALILFGFGAIELLAGIWAFIVLLKTLGEVHGFSAWRALGAILLGMLVVLFPIMLIAWILAIL